MTGQLWRESFLRSDFPGGDFLYAACFISLVSAPIHPMIALEMPDDRFDLDPLLRAWITVRENSLPKEDNSSLETIPRSIAARYIFCVDSSMVLLNSSASFRP